TPWRIREMSDSRFTIGRGISAAACVALAIALLGWLGSGCSTARDSETGAVASRTSEGSVGSAARDEAAPPADSEADAPAGSEVVLSEESGAAKQGYGQAPSTNEVQPQSVARQRDRKSEPAPTEGARPTALPATRSGDARPAEPGARPTRQAYGRGAPGEDRDRAGEVADGAPQAAPALGLLDKILAGPADELWILERPTRGADAIPRDESSPGSGALVAKVEGETNTVPVPLEHTD